MTSLRRIGQYGAGAHLLEMLHTVQHFRGLVTLKKSLNYEERSSYNLVVEAQDAGDNILSSTASIFVQVSATTAIL